ncbi:hypothetical protein E2562_005690 [Oryza meyeriana var. granulata]|uniref:UBA domain-containing protein n=1 Tax=Oryza meyeriana var. granulata TaxID=110450 RepID=A0A6G1F495_9ORYZ|nr:hypothetical protein E2562_005690 [Oryza meyeriana var. granulata]
MDNAAAVATFMEITSCGSQEAAVQHLASCRWDLEAAINGYFIFGGASAAAPAPAPSGAEAPDDGVRAPIPARSDTLYGDMYGRARLPNVRPAPSVWGEQPPSVTPAVAPVHIQMPSATPSVPAPVPYTLNLSP